MPVGVVTTTQGTDIGPLLNAAATEQHMPTRVLVAIAIAESGLSETAERYGARTAEALECIAVLIAAGEWP
jgi:hypothetical protein